MLIASTHSTVVPDPEEHMRNFPEALKASRKIDARPGPFIQISRSIGRCIKRMQGGREGEEKKSIQKIVG